MKKFTAFLTAFVFATQCVTPALAALTEPDRALLYGRNFLVNPGAESGLAAVTASTSAHLGTDNANIDTGNSAFKWSPTGAGETLTFGFVVIASGAGLSGQAGVLSCKFKSANGVQSHSMAAWDGSSLINSATLSLTSTSFGRGSIQVNFPTSGNYTLRLTSGAADTLYIDSCYLGTAEGSPLNVLGMAGSNTTSYTPTLSGFTGGTQTLTKATWWRDGQWMFVDVAYALSGTQTGASSITLSIPSPYTIDTTTLVSTNGQEQLGTYRVPGSTSFFGSVGYNGAGNLVSFFKSSTSANMTGADFAGAATFTASFKVPIAGWSANIAQAVSSTFFISSYLVSGSRVTTTPTSLGQYRALFKSANSSGGTDGVPTTTPTTADGMKILSVPYASAGATDPNRWEIFVGKNKTIQCNWWPGTGKTGSLDISNYVSSSGTFQVGATCGYDPTSGVVYVDTMYQDNTGVTTRRVGNGVSSSGSAYGTQASGYFDIKVSDNALSVGMDALQLIANQKNMVLVGAQITCGNSGSTINSQGSPTWLSSVSNGGSTGCCGLTYTGTFSSAPFISGCSNTSAGNSSCGFVSAPGTNSVSVCGSQAGTLTNGTLSVWFMGPR